LHSLSSCLVRGDGYVCSADHTIRLYSSAGQFSRISHDFYLALHVHLVYRLSYVGWGAYALCICIGIRALIRGYGTRMIHHVYISIPALIRRMGYVSLCVYVGTRTLSI